jgi:hypothetical protein
MAILKLKNPFYVLLMIVGTAFALTACGFTVMAVRMSRQLPPGPGDEFFDAYGMWLMLAQLALLAVLTFAAIGTDDYWTRRAARHERAACHGRLVRPCEAAGDNSSKVQSSTSDTK